MPTLLGLAGIALPAGIQGTDLSHTLLGEDGPEPDSVYLQIMGPGWPHRGEWVGFLARAAHPALGLREVVWK